MKTLGLLFLIALASLSAMLVQTPQPPPDRVSMVVAEIEAGHLPVSLRQE